MLQRRVGKLLPEFNQTVLINQTQFDSTYFRLDDIPNELTAGKNMFKMYGNNQLLQNGSEILVQVTDVNGNAVYHHVNNYVDPAGRLVIGIWVYPETPPGLGKIEILGKATSRPDGRPVSKNWRNLYNIKWSREIIIRPDAINKSPIIFQTIPGIKIFEYEREYLTQTYTSGQSIATQENVGTLTYYYNGYGDAHINIAGGNFSASMAGGLLTIPTPNFTLPSGYSLQTGATTEYTSYVSQVVSNTLIKVDPYVLYVQSTQQSNTGTSGGGKTALNISTVNSAMPVSSFGPISNYTLQWQQEATYATGSTNSQSFASITLKNIDPIVGKVHSIKTNMKSHGFAAWETVSHEILQERDLLISINSDLAYDAMGEFRSQEIIDTFWDVSTPNQVGLVPYVKHDDSQLISSMLITGSEFLSGSTNYPSAPATHDPYIKVSTNTSVDIYKNNEYQVKFKVTAESDSEISSSYMDVYISGSGIGSTDGRNLGHKLITLESENQVPALVTNVSQFNGILSLINSAGPVNAPSVNTYTTPPASLTATEITATWSSNTAETVNPASLPGVNESLLELSYTPSTDTTAHIVFAVTRGKWYISDVELEGASDYGFTPNHTFLEFPIQTHQADDILDFKFEFYNPVGEIANIILTTQSLAFVGSNVFIDGTGNVLSGSINIGNGIVMQGFTG